PGTARLPRMTSRNEGPEGDAGSPPAWRSNLIARTFTPRVLGSSFWPGLTTAGTRALLVISTTSLSAGSRPFRSSVLSHQGSGGTVAGSFTSSRPLTVICSQVLFGRWSCTYNPCGGSFGSRGITSRALPSVHRNGPSPFSSSG